MMDLFGRAFKIGRLFGIDVQIHFLFLLWIGFQLITPQIGLMEEVIFLAMLFGTVLVHEFGHCFGARAVGGDASHIVMWPLGGLAHADAPMRPWPQFVTVAAGPLVNVAFCVITGALLMSTAAGREMFTLSPFGMWYALDPAYWETYVQYFYRVNLLLLCFNLLPVFPLDGGQIFRTIVWRFTSLRQATLLAAQVGIVGAVLMGIWGLMNQQLILLGIAVFGGMISWQHYQSASGGLLADEYLSANYVLRERVQPRRGIWSRIKAIFSRRQQYEGDGYDFSTGSDDDRERWGDRRTRRRQEKEERDQEREETELDRLLRKVSEHGINALSYVERQKLERITRKRRDRETRSS